MEQNIDEKFYKKYQFIVGVDEVGRGPLCGPVVACAMILPRGYFNTEIDDSKKLSKKKREKLAEIIKKECVEFQIGEVSPKEIDEINILEAARKAMTIAIHKLKTNFDIVLSDCMEFKKEKFKYESFVKGDAKSQNIAAASIVAKVYRDALMEKLSKKYPEYNFEKNSGYGTKEHLEAIKKYGIIPNVHRLSFAPVKKYQRKINKK